MADYKERLNFVDHNFITTTCTVDKLHKMQGLHMLEVERNEDEVTTMEVDDGTAIMVEGNSRTGEIRMHCLEASPSNTYMSDLAKERRSFAISILDTNAPEMKADGKYCRVKKRPIIRRQRDHQVVEWVCVVTYLDCHGAGYTLESA